LRENGIEIKNVDYFNSNFEAIINYAPCVYSGCLDWRQHLVMGEKGWIIGVNCITCRFFAKRDNRRK